MTSWSRTTRTRARNLVIIGLAFAIRARVPVGVLRDTIQPFPTFSEIYVEALKELWGEISAVDKRAKAGAKEDS